MSMDLYNLLTYGKEAFSKYCELLQLASGNKKQGAEQYRQNAEYYYKTAAKMFDARIIRKITKHDAKKLKEIETTLVK